LSGNPERDGEMRARVQMARSVESLSCGSGRRFGFSAKAFDELLGSELPDEHHLYGQHPNNLNVTEDSRWFVH